VDGYPSSYFKSNNRGVKGLTLNLKDPRGKEIFYKLVAQADVFSQNFRPGAAEKNGFGYEVLKKVKPKALCLNLGIWPGWPPCAAAGNERRGPSAKWGRRSVFKPWSTTPHRYCVRR
jgi:crotonobetainyl-CoA:carnitine CoA-transferase CaiB-like acyl-CoA transferase